CRGAACCAPTPRHRTRRADYCWFMAPTSLHLSKSRFLAGLQCHKQLWWRVHEPDAPELVPDAALRNVLNQGNEVGRRAREYVPGGELVDLPFYQFDNKVAQTRDILQREPSPPALYEATFLADDTYAAVDILERGPRGYEVVEVKATNRLKPEHLPDVALQVHVLRRAADADGGDYLTCDAGRRAMIERNGGRGWTGGRGRRNADPARVVTDCMPAQVLRPRGRGTLYSVLRP